MQEIAALQEKLAAQHEASVDRSVALEEGRVTAAVDAAAAIESAKVAAEGYERRIKHLEDSLQKAEQNCEVSRSAVTKASERLAEQAKVWADTNQQGEARYHKELEEERKRFQLEREDLAENLLASRKEISDLKEAHAKQIAALEEGARAGFHKQDSGPPNADSVYLGV